MQDINCRICARPLTNPKSMHRGIGPDCAGKSKAMAASSAKQEHGGPLFLHDTGHDFVFKLVDGRQASNVVQHEIRHSPTGMGFAYGGSGAADMALNILITACGREVAYYRYQDFKRAFIETMPETGGVITLAQVRNWTSAQEAAEPLPRFYRAPKRSKARRGMSTLNF
jgi:hypothetical protein